MTPVLVILFGFKPTYAVGTGLAALAAGLLAYGAWSWVTGRPTVWTSPDHA